ncbi:hypothetical protein K502DRAFT_330004 [Neoconidiobolus thromboides FSU 785]|nr:hypothetical protein K502DRAFT_330004 [Neoconidiobolus thromboides FSU 785]
MMGFGFSLFRNQLNYRVTTGHTKLLFNSNQGIKLSTKIITEETIVIQEIDESKVKSSKSKIEKIKIVLDEKEIIEKFIKGSGNGGQAINKTNSRVELKHLPTGIVVQCQKTRSQSENRKIARKMLREQLDILYNKELSKRNIKKNKVNKQKKKQAKRAREKYGDKLKENKSEIDGENELNDNSMEDKNVVEVDQLNKIKF